ncbi:MAG: NADH-quinone oxidoreductase subunit D [Alphaproteobacteria bacterium]|nr:NADH-quinone oxidoreductase subunit D [Alphaproteobacteria bacterium]
MSEEIKVRTTTLNFGPQHPSSHGVLRMVLELDGELVKRVEPHVGQLHRGTEKLIEHKTYTQNIPFFDRLDYVSPINYEHAWVLAAEKLLQLEIPERAKYIRVLFLELSRISRHLFGLGAQAMDAGAMTPMIWAFESREQIMEFFEATTGARMHTNYFRVGGVAIDLPEGLTAKIQEWTYQFEKDFKDAMDLVVDNRIFKQRSVNIGKVDKNQALDFGFTGPNLRAAGVAWDLRKAQPYEIYDKLDFDVIVGTHGDAYDRFLVRIGEVYESIKLIRQCILHMPAGLVKTDNYKFTTPPRAAMKESMESLIHHFKFFSEGFYVPEGEVYVPVETPTGEFGVYLVSKGKNKPYRAKLRSNGFAHLQAIKQIGVGYQLADLSSILGSLDVVFGEIDR